jgi:hypothetical protein
MNVNGTPRDFSGDPAMPSTYTRIKSAIKQAVGLKDA